MAALVALIDVAAEKGRAAILDGMKNAALIGIQQMAVFFNELVSMSADHIGHLVGWPLHHGLVWVGATSASSGLTVF